MKYLLGAVLFGVLALGPESFNEQIVMPPALPVSDDCIFSTIKSLKCWRCSSDILPECRDHFNQSEILARRGGGSSLYDSLQQNYQQGQRFDPNYDNQRQYDQNYPAQARNQRQYDPSNGGQRIYDQNYNQNQRQFGQNYNPSLSLNNRLPELETCDENEARLNRKRTVCLKEIIRGNNYVSVIRRCESIPFEQTVGTCQPSTVNRGLQLDFCEYCDYDGCNTATGLKINTFLAVLIIFVLHMVNN